MQDRSESGSNNCVPCCVEPVLSIGPVVSVSAPTPPQELGAPGASVRSLAFSAPGKSVAAGRIDGAVELWAWQEGARLAAFPAHSGCVAALLFLHAGGRFLTAGEDGKVSLQRACGRLRGAAKAGVYSCDAGRLC